MCINAAVNGRSSKSFIDEGRWRDALALKGDYYLIQFGHNDEPGKGPERETDPHTTYAANMARYVDEARAIGAKPILVTSLTRRRFDAGGKIVPNLDPYVDVVKHIAAAKQVPLLDLHARSIELAEQLGDEAWAALSPRDADGDVDRTHLNTRGSLRVAPLVIAELRAHVPELAGLFTAEPAANAIVSADGGADYTTVLDAILALPQNTRADRRWVIFVRAGTYRELIYIQREKRFVSLIGEDPLRTMITFNLDANKIGFDGKIISTFRTPTVVVDADDFAAENLTFQNDAGPGRAGARAARGRRPRHLPQLPLPRLAGHHLPRPWASVFRGLVHRRARGLHLRRLDGVLRAQSPARLAQRLYHRGLDDAGAEVRLRVRERAHHRRSPARRPISGARGATSRGSRSSTPTCPTRFDRKDGRTGTIRSARRP